MPKQTFTHLVLPSVLFPAISAVAAYVIFGHAYGSGTWSKVHDKCSALHVSPYSLPYTNIWAIDYQLCCLTAVFHSLLDQPYLLSFNAHLLAGLAAMAVIPAIENAREKRSGWLSLHTIIALVYQRLTAAAIMPWYWLIFITTGAASRPRNAGAKITQSQAEAILFSLTVGCILPSLAMLYLDNPYFTAFWQPFPLWMFLSHHFYLTFRPKNTSSGYFTIQLTWFIVFVISAAQHIHYMGPTIRALDHVTYGHLYTPGLAIPDPQSTTLEAGVLDFIQWDVQFVSLSTLLACLYTTRSFVGALGMLLWFVGASVAFGPGSVLAGLFAWREMTLNG